MRGPLTAEMALFRLVNSCMMAQEWTCVITMGNQFAQRHPGSPYLAGVQSSVRAAEASIRAQQR